MHVEVRLTPVPHLVYGVNLAGHAGILKENLRLLRLFLVALRAANLLLLSSGHGLKISDRCHAVRSLRVRIFAIGPLVIATVLGSLESVNTGGEGHFVGLRDSVLELVSLLYQCLFLGV